MTDVSGGQVRVGQVILPVVIQHLHGASCLSARYEWTQSAASSKVGPAEGPIAG